LLAEKALGWGQSSALVQAFVTRSEVVPVSSASSVDEGLAHASLLVVEVADHAGSAHSDLGALVAVWAVQGILAFTLLGRNTLSVGVLDVTLLAVASNYALHGADFGWVLEVVAGQRASSSTFLELFVLTANGSAGALFWQNTFSVGVLDVSLLAVASNYALKSTEFGWVLVVVAGQWASCSTLLEFLVLTAYGLAGALFGQNAFSF